MVFHELQEKQEVDRNENDVKVFVDDIVRTVEVDPGIVLEAAYKLHIDLQFTIKEHDTNGKWPFWI